MSELIAQIKVLNNHPDYTKHDGIVEGIASCIEEEIIKRGDALPSINQLSTELGFARETIVKAYNSLKDKGIINSKHGLGYYIANDELDIEINIALIMYGFQSFQQTFYNSFRKSLGKKYKIDVFFHHNNLDVYKSILQNIRMKYGMYVIAPIQKPEAEKMLHTFPSKKLLLVDRYQYINENVAHITQEFELTLTSIFEKLSERFKSFKKVIFFYREDSDYPIGIKKAFHKFCAEEKINIEIYEQYDSHLLQKNTAYFTVGDADLWALIKDAKDSHYTLGKDIGILSHNDSPVKELVEGGITTFSTDFTLMAQKASNYLKDRKMVKEIVPIKLIIRKSL